MFKGSIVALVTPMHATGEIDWDTYADLIEWHIENSTDAITIAGTTGESPTLSLEEHIKLIKFGVDCAKKRVPIIAGTGANNTKEAIALSISAMESKADACLIVTPYYNKPTQQGMYQHFVAIASSIKNMPIILYDVPGRTMVELQVDTIKKLSSIKNIVGIKDATGNIDKAVSIRENCEDDFIILSGDDETFLQSMIEAKANGTISVTANVFPKSMHDICKCVENNDIEQARKINKSILPMHKALFVESNPIPVKYALNKMEKIPSGIRLPLSWLSDKQKNKLDIALEATKKFK